MANAAPTLTRTRVALDSMALEGLERAQVSSKQEVGTDDDHRYQRVGGREWNVVRHAREVVHDVADEFGVADQAGRDVVAQREREREDGTRNDVGESHREDDVTKRVPPLATQVARRLQVGLGDPFERSVDG